MPIRAENELQELVDNPNETLEVEHKEWLELADNGEARADLARHIAALCNHGGGVIVFGFTDSMQVAGPSASPKVSFDRDTVSAIVKKYLEPTFQCDVRLVRSSLGNEHPIIIVPPHGAAPICAKAGGPVIAGRTRGIAQGIYYIRKPGPESAPIAAAAEWAPIIRRCAMHERASIIGALDAALRGAAAPTAATTDQLKTWHDAAHDVFLKDITEYKARAELAKWHCQFSYAIERSDGQRLRHEQLPQILREVNAEVRDLVQTGWSMFHLFSRQDIKPFFDTDPASGQGDEDFFETAMLRATDSSPFGHMGIDMWRVSTDGKATIIREYWEDHDWPGVPPGRCFSPNMMVRSLAEVIRHARGLAERFAAPTAVSIRCEWYGLAGRIAYDPRSPWMRDDGDKIRSDHRVAAGTWPIGTFTTGWAEVVAQLAAPVARALGLIDVITPQWILGQAPTWLR